MHRPDAGEVKLNNRPVIFTSPRAALAAGIGALLQERNLIPRFSVGENLLLERERYMPPMYRTRVMAEAWPLYELIYHLPREHLIDRDTFRRGRFDVTMSVLI